MPCLCTNHNGGFNLTSSSTYNGCADECANSGETFACIASAEERDAARELLKIDEKVELPGRAWIAIDDAEEEGTWMCRQTETEIEYSSWADHQPDGEAECVGRISYYAFIPLGIALLLFIGILFRRTRNEWKRGKVVILTDAADEFIMKFIFRQGDHWNKDFCEFSNLPTCLPACLTSCLPHSLLSALSACLPVRSPALRPPPLLPLHVNQNFRDAPGHP